MGGTWASLGHTYVGFDRSSSDRLKANVSSLILITQVETNKCLSLCHIHIFSWDQVGVLHIKQEKLFSEWTQIPALNEFRTLLLCGPVSSQICSSFRANILPRGLPEHKKQVGLLKQRAV